MLPTPTHHTDAQTSEPAGHESVGSCHDEEVASWLGVGSDDSLSHAGAVRLEEDCLPVAVVADAVEATARVRGDALRKQSAERARDVLAEAERDVRALLAEGLPESEFAARSSEIVARADREVRQILARGRSDAEVIEMRVGHQAAEMRAHAADHAADAMLLDDQVPESDLTPHEPRSDETEFAERPAVEILAEPHAIVEMASGRSADEPCFASLRAAPLPSPTGELRFRVTGSLTFATMLAFEQAVSRLPGVSLASVTPEPSDVAILALTASDTSLIPPLLVWLPGIRLQVEAA
jgi:hypothetical protein